MKQCPSCKTTYTDETLRYCLADGSALNAIDDGESTIVRSSVAEPTVVMGYDPTVRIDIARAEIATRVIDQPQKMAPVETRRSSGTLFKILAVFTVLGVLAALIAVAGGLVYYNTRIETASVNNAKTAATATPTPSKDESNELREQIANLSKRLDEQKRSSNQDNLPIKLPGRAETTTRATVNSPSDGFLALRSLPNSDAGERIAKIPHGRNVTIGACGPIVTPVKRSGRWCQATYDGLNGWVFDAYLIY